MLDSYLNTLIFDLKGAVSRLFSTICLKCQLLALIRYEN